MNTEHIPVRSHVLQKMDCPELALASLMEQEEDPSAAMEKGTTTHAMVFNTQTVVVYPGAVRRGKEWDKFEAEHDGCRIVLQGEYEVSARMCDAVRKHPIARELIDGAELEKTRLFKIDGRLCRATPDIVRPGSYIADLKTGRSANPRKFRYNARDYYYDASMAWYRRAAGVQDVYIICVEKSSPRYPVTVFKMNARSLAQGDAFNAEAFAKFRECERSGRWPGYAEGIVELDIPERNAASLAYTEAAPEAAA